MARVSTANSSKADPLEWVGGTRAARAARKLVIGQLAELITDADLTGSPELVARRVSQVAEALKHDDPMLQRSELMDLAVASAATAAGLDLRPRHRAAA